jgi:hypothetical protein
MESLEWSCMPVIPALGGWGRRIEGFKASLGCIVRSCLKKQGLGIQLSDGGLA